MKRYRDLSSWLKEKYGSKVYKVSLTAATTCPNLDGTLAKGGCSFCNDAAYSPLALAKNRRGQSIATQLKEGIAYVKKRHRTPKFISYFQSFTSTYGDKKILLEKFKESLDHPDVVGLALSTRPDCIDEAWIESLLKFGKNKICWIELGLQSANDAVLAKINRWHTRRQFSEAMKILSRYPIPVCAHAVLGLPGETRKDVLETARYLATQPIHGIKIHNLHVVKGTTLANEYQRGEYTPLDLETFVDWGVDFLEQTPPHLLVHRLNAHAPRDLTLAPDWSVNKLGVFNAVEN
ncbi:MAG: TIGR01212 family radical SAM protein, partial [bacterium]|nr:TIGR01212 family radical SAM protein [bacterium]